MIKKKIYAVRKGRQTGLFNDWGECEKQTRGFSGAEFKSFTNVENAKKYLAEECELSDSEKLRTNPIPVDIKIYVDGSWNEEKQIYGWGFVAVRNGQIMYRKSGSGNNPKYIGSRQIGGEVAAVLQGINYAIHKEYECVEICYDFIGIEAWPTGKWDTLSEIASAYVYLLNKKKEKIAISFRKVLAHSNDRYNNIADRLAKNGAEI